MVAATVGEGTVTVSVALASALLVAPALVVSAPAGIVFVYVPATELVTFTLMVQVAPAATEPLESLTCVAPAAAETVPLPQVVDAAGTGATVTPLGSESVRPIPDIAAAPEVVFAMEIVSVLAAGERIVVGLKALVTATFGVFVNVHIRREDVPVSEPGTVSWLPESE